MKEYFAGLFDGEGSVGIYRYDEGRREGTPKLVVQIGMNDVRPLRVLHESYPGSWLGQHTNEQWGETWKWGASKQSVADQFLRDILPHSISKKEQIEVALEFLTIPRGRGNRLSREELDRAHVLSDQLKSLKGRS